MGTSTIWAIINNVLANIVCFPCSISWNDWWDSLSLLAK